jgi:hypothetical protein
MKYSSSKHRTRANNFYNIFFILERQKLIQEKEGWCGTTAVEQRPRDLAGYECLSLPDLPPRFQDLQLPQGWFVSAGKNPNRKHVKSHGCEYANIDNAVALFCAE